MFRRSESLAPVPREAILLHAFTSAPRNCLAGRAPAPPVKGGERRAEEMAAGTCAPPAGAGGLGGHQPPLPRPRGWDRQPDLLRLQRSRARQHFSCGEPLDQSLGMVPLVPLVTHRAAGLRALPGMSVQLMGGAIPAGSPVSAGTGLHFGEA